MSTNDVKELRRRVDFRCDRLREQIEASGGGATEVELTIFEARDTIELLEELIARVEQAP